MKSKPSQSVLAPPLFQTVRADSTRDKVYQAIKEAILSGRLETGQRITEPVLAKEFCVSRAVIREALQQLAHEGLVEQNTYKGTRVVQLTPEQIDEALSARLLLETELIRQVWGKLTQTDKQELRSLARTLETAINVPQRYAELDLQLHQRLWELSGNQTFRKLLEQVTMPLFAMGTIMRYSKIYGSRARTNGGKPSRPSDHLRLIEAICSGTQQEAVQAMQQHITHNWGMTRERAEALQVSRSLKKKKN
ncbi:MAG: GntR family transcriptional regulator [Blastocatellia bacterium]|nr:GntR family transcriptional regulator [Blastocatellia bacterium]